MRAGPIFLALAAAGILGWLFWSEGGPSPRDRSSNAVEARPTAAPPPRTGSGGGPAAAAMPSVDAPSQLVDGLDSPQGNIHADLRMINAVFAAYRGATHATNPIGENIEITEVLTGRNKLGFAFIPRHHPAINAKGELCDRWGTPFFFHQLSGERMEIRSAGPDGKFFTPDDQVLTP